MKFFSRSGVGGYCCGNELKGHGLRCWVSGIAFGFGLICASYCADYTLAWDPVQGSNIAGYRVYYGHESHRYHSFIEVPAGQTQYRFENLPNNKKYVFAVTAFTHQDESGYSNEVGASVDWDEALGTLSDDFSEDTSALFDEASTWTNPVGRLVYVPGALLVETADNAAYAISRKVPKFVHGRFHVDFRPLRQYPRGGVIEIRFKQDDKNYFFLRNSDGYGPGQIGQVVNGEVVVTAPFEFEYQQLQTYPIDVTFSPDAVVVDAFADRVTIQPVKPQQVKRVWIESRQQDAYYDQLSVVSFDAPPVWEGLVGVQYAEDVETGDTVALEFNDAVDGLDSNIGFNVYFQPETNWNQNDWSANSSVFFASTVPGNLFKHRVLVGGLESDVEYRFGVRASDSEGNEDGNTATITATPTGSRAVDFINDTFLSGSLSKYLVTDSWTAGGVGSFEFDPEWNSAVLLTGNDIGLVVTRTVPAATEAVFQFEGHPAGTYPFGGITRFILAEDVDNHYVIQNSDGYGPFECYKVVDGEIVSTAKFTNEYRQGIPLSILIEFSPGEMVVDGFGGRVRLNSDNNAVLVQEISVECRQQDMVFYRFRYVPAGADETAGGGTGDPEAVDDDSASDEVDEGEAPGGEADPPATSDPVPAPPVDLPPVWVDLVGIQEATDLGTGGSVLVEFDGATDDRDGDGVGFHVFYAPASDWADLDWFGNAVIMHATVEPGQTYENQIVIGGLDDDVEYRFGVWAVDGSGNLDGNTVTRVAKPTRPAPIAFEPIDDRFSIESMVHYEAEPTWTAGGVGSFVYSPVEQGAVIVTGDNVGLSVTRNVPQATAGRFEFEIHPRGKYPLAGVMRLKFSQDSENFFVIQNSDGNGPLECYKVIGGEVVDSAGLLEEYHQGRPYSIGVQFSPGYIGAIGIGGGATMTGDLNPISVNQISVECIQQDLILRRLLYVPGSE